MTDQTDRGVDARIASALRAARNAVPHTPGDVVMADVRSARDRHVNRRRRRARIVALGAAAAVLVLVAGVAVLVTGDDSGRQHVASQEPGKMRAATADASPLLQVAPSTGLTDGSVVTVSGIGDVLGDDATPSSAVVAQCAVVGDRTHLACAESVFDALDEGSRQPPDRMELTVSDPLTPLFELRTDRSGRTTIGDWSEDAGLFCDAGAGSTAPAVPEGSDDLDGVDPDSPVSSDGNAASSASSSNSGGDGTGTCVIAVYLASGTAPPTVVPIFFGDDEPDDPGTATGSAGDPGHGSTVGEPLPGTGSGEVPAECPPERVFLDRTTESDTKAPLLAFTPDEATVCTYDVAGAIGARTIDNPDELASLQAALNGLAVPDPDMACTDEMGPAVAIVATGAGRTETVWLEFYGCGAAHNGDVVRVGAKDLSDLVG